MPMSERDIFSAHSPGQDCGLGDGSDRFLFSVGEWGSQVLAPVKMCLWEYKRDACGYIAFNCTVLHPPRGLLPERETQNSSLRSSKLLFVFFLIYFPLVGIARSCRTRSSNSRSSACRCSSGRLMLG